MQRFILTMTLVTGTALALSAPSTVYAQYGYYGNYRGGGHNFNAHVRSLSPPGYIYQQAYAPAYGYGAGYGGSSGYGNYGYGGGYGRGPNCGYHSHGYAPYGGYGGGFGGGSISIRW